MKVLDNVKLKLSANAAPKAITKWIYDIAVQGIKPQDWTLDTHMVQGIFNDIIIASGIAKSPESYHFTDILELKSRIFAEQMRKLEFKGSNPAWNEMAELGVTELAIDFCEKLIKAEKAGQEFDECLSKEGVYVTDLANGNFSLVDPAIFLTACNRVSVSKRGAFLEFLKDKFQLNDQAEGAIDDIINHAMGDGASQGAVDDVVPGESAELIGDDDSYS